MTKKIIVGLVGAGCLGRAIMKQILRRAEFEYLICDKVKTKAKQLAEEIECRAVSIKETVKMADYIYLALPPTAMRLFLMEHEMDFKKNAAIINLSTSVDSKELESVLKRKDISVIGIKPVCQATAMREGRKVVFVSSSNSEKLNAIKDMLCEIGEVIIDEEMKVQKINEYATLRALELIIQLEKDLEELNLDNRVKNCAIGTVAVGTLMDYPYVKENINEYITILIKKYDLALY